MRAILALCLLGACGTDAGHYPPGMAPLVPGTGTLPAGPDAGAAGGDAGAAAIVGGLCAVTDVRILTPCAPLTGTSLRVTVRESGASATVGADGRFSLPAPPGLTQVTLVTSTDDRTFFGSAVTVDLGSAGTAVATIPVLRQADVTDLAVAAGAALAPGAGVVVVHTASGATLDSAGGAIPYYDTGSPGQLTSTPPTGPAGVAVYFNVAGPLALTIHTRGATRSVTATAIGGAGAFVSAPL